VLVARHYRISAGVIEIFISQPILEEIEGVLIRKFRWTASRVREAARAIRGFAVLVNPGESVSDVHEDEPGFLDGR